MNAEVDLQPMERVRSCGCGVRFVAKLDSCRIYYSRLKGADCQRLSYSVFPLLPSCRSPHNSIGTCRSWLRGHFRLDDSPIKSSFGSCGLDNNS